MNLSRPTPLLSMSRRPVLGRVCEGECLCVGSSLGFSGSSLCKAPPPSGLVDAAFRARRSADLRLPSSPRIPPLAGTPLVPRSRLESVLRARFRVSEGSGMAQVHRVLAGTRACGDLGPCVLCRDRDMATGQGWGTIRAAGSDRQECQLFLSSAVWLWANRLTSLSRLPRLSHGCRELSSARSLWALNETM